MLLQKLVGAVLVFGLVFTPYSLISDWRFFDDDYGAVHAGSIEHPLEVLAFFSSNPNDRSIYPSNMRDDCTWSFLGVMYRPLTLVTYALNVWLFGPDGKALFLASVGLHALAASLITFVLLLFLPWMYGLFGGLYFGFYPIMGHFVGHISMQQYSLTLICLLSACLLLKRYIDSDNNLWLLLSVGTYGLAPFFHETALIFPAWLCLMLPFYLDFQRLVPGFSAIGRSIVVSIPYVFMVFINLGLRLWAYPFALETEYMVFEPLQIIKLIQHRLFDLITLAVDAVGATPLPAGNRLLKASVVMIVLVYFWVLWWRSSRKKEMFLIGLGFFCFAWPSILITHQARYLYTAITFIIAVVMLGLSSLNGSRRFIVVMHIIPLFLVFSGGLYGFQVTKARSIKSVIVDENYKKLASMPEIKGRSICFVGVPFEWFPVSGAAQAIWMHQDGEEFPVYHDRFFEVHCVKTRSHLLEQEVPRGDFVKIEVVNNLVQMTILDKQKAWFRLENSIGKPFESTMGAVSVLDRTGDKGYEINVLLDERWVQTNPVFVTWNYPHGGFTIVQSS